MSTRQIECSFFMPNLFPYFIMKEVDKNSSGKCDEIEFQIRKTDSSLFIHYSLFSESLAFALPNLSFDQPKGYVSCGETSSFARRNLTFRATKPKLSQICIL